MLNPGVILKKIHLKSQLGLAYEAPTMHIAELMGWQREWYGQIPPCSHDPIHHLVMGRCKTSLTVRYTLV